MGDAGIGGGSGGAPPGPDEFEQLGAQEQAATHGFRDYYRVLASNRHFRLLWTAEMIDNIGSWLSYVATLELASQLGGSGLALSAVVLIRFLPSLLLAPVCGVVADRLNRVRVLVVAAVADAAVMLVLALVPLAPRGAQMPLLYLLLALQFSAMGFYDPARKALVPVLVPASELHLAATVDSWAWSITGAVGASVGGLVASRLGKSACFLVDAGSYLLAAWCALQLPVALGAPDAAFKPAKKRSSAKQVELGGLGELASDGRSAAEHSVKGARRQGRGSLDALGSLEEAQNGGHGPAVTHAERRHQHQRQPLAPLAREPAALHAGGPLAQVAAHQELEWQLGPASEPSAGHSAAPAGGRATPHVPGGGSALVRAARAAMAEGVVATHEGWAYVSSPANRDVAALVLMKCAAALVWGAIDILNVQFSEQEAMQTLGDASTTLGLIFAAVGLGCFIGPVALNAFIPPQAPALRWGVAASYWLFAVGLLVMLLSPSIWLVLSSTIIRSMGSAALWVYSTLLMQQRVQNDFLGRMAAVESAGYTVAETISSVFGGAAFDVFHLTLQQLLLILTAAAVLEALLWSGYAFLTNRSESRRSAARGDYLPVRQKDTQDDEF